MCFGATASIHRRLLTFLSEARISRTTAHSGAIKALQFNPFKPELLATAGAKGELYITDLNNASNPFRLGTSAARADDFECIDWNKKIPHILATGSSGGFVTVWDLKAKKESLQLNNYGRKAVSAVAWDPDEALKLLTATPNDQEPLILSWHLRNTNAPERILRGHDQGLLSLSWCPQDSDLLLSCGKDNRTICWNPHTGTSYGEFPVVTNWTFQTRWNPHNPSLLATASFDGKIWVHTIQSTKVEPASAEHMNQTADGEDFFTKAQTQPQGASFSLPNPPRWMKRPVSVSFGFGGKVVKLGPTEPGSNKSRISISTFAIDSDITTATEKFEASLRRDDLKSICETKVSSATTEEEKADWSVVETLISDAPRQKLLQYLGFSDTAEEMTGKVADLGAGQDNGAQINGDSKNNRLSGFFDQTDGEDSFLADIAATKDAKTNNPFRLYTGTESDADKKITRALLLGSFEKAVDVCLKEERMADAFMIAICGGQSCIDKAQAAYFTKKSKGPNYLRLLASVVGKNLWDMVYNADLENWKEVMATLCTFADQAEFPDLCDALGDRLDEAVKHGSRPTVHRRDASFCFLAGSKLEKVVDIWIQELRESEKAGFQGDGDDTSFSVHARALQSFIEKVTVFRKATKFQDDQSRNSLSQWKLAPLYDLYAQYADILAAHGLLQVAEQYLDLLPEKYEGAEVARNRVKRATRTSEPQPAATQSAAAAGVRSAHQARQSVPSFQSMQTTAVQPAKPMAPSSYAPVNTMPTLQQPSNLYTPTAGSNVYTPAGFQPQQQMPQSQPPPQPYGMQYQQPGANLTLPPRGFAASSTQPPPPPPRAKDASAWNDLPADFGNKPPTSRRGTPGLVPQPISSPFPTQPSMQPPAPPMAGPPSLQQRLATPPLPPPPKAGEAPPASHRLQRTPTRLRCSSPVGLHPRRPHTHHRSHRTRFQHHVKHS